LFIGLIPQYVFHFPFLSTPTIAIPKAYHFENYAFHYNSFLLFLNFGISYIYMYDS